MALSSYPIADGEAMQKASAKIEFGLDNPPGYGQLIQRTACANNA